MDFSSLFLPSEPYDGLFEATEYSNSPYSTFSTLDYLNFQATGHITSFPTRVITSTFKGTEYADDQTVKRRRTVATKRQSTRKRPVRGARLKQASSPSSTTTATSIVRAAAAVQTSNSEASKHDRKVDPFAPECSIPLPFQIGDEYGYYEPSSIWKRNERERHRVRCVNDGYDKLRNHLPFASAEKRLSKVETLRLAIAYIHHLEKLLENPEHEHVCDCNLQPNPTPSTTPAGLLDQEGQPAEESSYDEDEDDDANSYT